MNMREQFEAWWSMPSDEWVRRRDISRHELAYETWQAAYQAGVLAERERLEGTIDHLLDNVRMECAALAAQEAKK
jgi:hypothetical protein